MFVWINNNKQVDIARLSLDQDAHHLVTRILCHVTKTRT